MICIAFYHILESHVELLYPVISLMFLLVLFLFPLKGSLVKKVLFLVVSGLLCLLFNILTCCLISQLAEYLDNAFNILHIIASPLLNVLWLVSLYSLGLSFVTHSKSEIDHGADNVN